MFPNESVVVLSVGGHLRVGHLRRDLFGEFFFFGDDVLFGDVFFGDVFFFGDVLFGDVPLR